MTAKPKLPRVFQVLVRVLLWTCNEAEVKEETNGNSKQKCKISMEDEKRRGRQNLPELGASGNEG